MFGGASTAGCRSRVAIDGTLSLGRCACPGFSVDPNEQLTAGTTDIETPRLRVAGQAVASFDPPPLRATKDLFDLPETSAEPPPRWRPHT
jgi:hypothetical protein